MSTFPIAERLILTDATSNCSGDCIEVARSPKVAAVAPKSTGVAETARVTTNLERRIMLRCFRLSCAPKSTTPAGDPYGTMLTMSTVLVTGGSGFIGSHCILQLLAAGHRVRTTVRNPKREADVRAMLRGGSAEGDRLSFVTADLEHDSGWQEAVAGCDYVLHVASPFPLNVPKDENELIVPARDGALRLLRAARDAGIKRVVLTSSFAAIGYGHEPRAIPFDETMWTNPDGDDVPPYAKSKVLAERAAWDFVAREGGGVELSVINPVV